MVLLEAMVRILVIASKAGGIPDIIKHKQRGVLVELGDINGFAPEIIAGWLFQRYWGLTPIFLPIFRV
jgi:glycosyltransferase involved in cell wall biosynthesis